MKPKHRIMDKRQFTTSAVSHHTRTKAMKKMLSLKRMSTPPIQKQSRNSLSSHALRNIVGWKISHGWKEENKTVTQWKAIVLDQLPTNPPLYLLKYEGIDSVHGLELYSDERIINLKILCHKRIFPQMKDDHFASAIVGRAVEHKFEGKHGSLDNWRGVILGQVPLMKDWFYITYLKDPILYMYQLMDDYTEGNLRILPEIPPTKVLSDTDHEVLTGEYVQYMRKNGCKLIGKVICQVLANPSVYSIKFKHDTHIHVFNLEKKIP